MVNRSEFLKISIMHNLCTPCVKYSAVYPRLFFFQQNYNNDKSKSTKSHSFPDY